VFEIEGVEVSREFVSLHGEHRRASATRSASVHRSIRYAVLEHEAERYSRGGTTLALSTLDPFLAGQCHPVAGTCS
jgi:hypothetical protein